MGEIECMVNDINARWTKQNNENQDDNKPKVEEKKEDAKVEENPEEAEKKK